MDTVDRIFDLLDKMPIEQQDFARLVGVSDDTASNWRRRKSASYSKYLSKIAETLGTTVEYLLTGETKTPAGQEAGIHLPPDFLQFLQKWDMLSADDQEEIRMIIDIKLARRQSSP